MCFQLEGPKLLWTRRSHPIFMFEQVEGGEMRNHKRNNKGDNGQTQGHKARSITYEEYIEVIFGLQQKHGHVHTNDLASSLGVAPPSVTEMVQKMAEKKLVDYTPYRGVTLTKEGEKIAKGKKAPLTSQVKEEKPRKERKKIQPLKKPGLAKA